MTDLFETLAEAMRPEEIRKVKGSNPFDVENLYPEPVETECKVKSHNYGVRHYGFCASCNSSELL